MSEIATQGFGRFGAGAKSSDMETFSFVDEIGYTEFAVSSDWFKNHGSEAETPEALYHLACADDASQLTDLTGKYYEKQQRDSKPAISPLNKGGTYYHVTPMENLPSIRKYGLVPQIGARSQEFGECSPGIYLFRSKEDMDNAMMNWLGDWLSEHHGEECELAILKIELPLNAELSVSPAGYECICKTTIPADHIAFYDETGHAISLPEKSTLTERLRDAQSRTSELHMNHSKKEKEAEL